MTTGTPRRAPDLTVQVPCVLCGDLLRRVADERQDEYVWQDESGGTTGTDLDLRGLQPDPDGRLAWLRGELHRALQASYKRTGKTWLYWARANEYSALRVRLESGTTHEHHPRQYEVSTAESAPPPPEHCGWPMRLRPSGWHCRHCPHVLT